MKTLLLLARQGADSPVNKWLSDNPHVLGLIAILIGVVLAGSGAYELSRGVAHDKRGNVIRGGRGRFVSIIRIVFGIAACGFGLYKMLAG